jgi:hypothetical protein
MSASAAMTYAVEAYNLSHASENKIHDDAIAQKLGFSGGLVPGVEVYAYACHLPVGRWGRTWLERGRMDCRFLKPVYDGHTATVSGTEADGGLDITVESGGILCATATASLPGADNPSTTLPSIDAYALRAPPSERPPADETSLAAGNVLGICPFVLTEQLASQYLGDVRETDPLYASSASVTGHRRGAAIPSGGSSPACRDTWPRSPPPGRWLATDCTASRRRSMLAAWPTASSTGRPRREAARWRWRHTAARGCGDWHREASSSTSSSVRPPPS